MPNPIHDLPAPKVSWSAILALFLAACASISIGAILLSVQRTNDLALQEGAPLEGGPAFAAGIAIVFGFGLSGFFWLWALAQLLYSRTVARQRQCAGFSIINFVTILFLLPPVWLAVRFCCAF